MKNYIRGQRRLRVFFISLGVFTLPLVVHSAIYHDWITVVSNCLMLVLMFFMASQTTWSVQIAEQNVELSKAQEKLNEELKKYRSREWEVGIAEKEKELGLGKWAKD